MHLGWTANRASGYLQLVYWGFESDYNGTEACFQLVEEVLWRICSSVILYTILILHYGFVPVTVSQFGF